MDHLMRKKIKFKLNETIITFSVDILFYEIMKKNSGPNIKYLQLILETENRQNQLHNKTTCG